MNLVKRTSNLNNLLKATSYTAVYPPPSDTVLVVPEKEVTLSTPKYSLNAYNLYSISPSPKGLRAIAGVSGKYFQRSDHLVGNILDQFDPDYFRI